jgi:hypothetical protein
MWAQFCLFIVHLFHYRPSLVCSQTPVLQDFFVLSAHQASEPSACLFLRFAMATFAMTTFAMTTLLLSYHDVYGLRNFVIELEKPQRPSCRAS